MEITIKAESEKEALRIADEETCWSEWEYVEESAVVCAGIRAEIKEY